MAYRSWSELAASARLLIAFALAAPAAAGQAADPSDAEALIKSGVELRKQGKESEALDRFRQAYQLEPTPRAAGQIGLAAKSLRRYVEAERYLAEALEASDDGWVRQNRQALELARELVGKQLASLLVRSDPPVAELLVNGSVIAELPLDRPVRVPAGAAVLEVRASGRGPWEKETTLAAGTITELSVTLPVLEAQPRPAQAKAAAPAPDVRPEPSETPSSRRTWMFVSAGVGLAGVAAGSWAGLVALDKKAERDEICPEASCPSEQGVELDRDARRAAVWSTVGFAVGAAGVTTAFVLWLTEPRQVARATRVIAAPLPSGGLVAGSVPF
jgi:hypothetical protein